MQLDLLLLELGTGVVALGNPDRRASGFLHVKARSEEISAEVGYESLIRDSEEHCRF
jgi:hypothetical protein